MNKLWIGFLVALLVNFVLSTLDYLSTSLGSPLILMTLLILLTVGLGIAVIANARTKNKTGVIVLILLLVSHYETSGMLFAMAIWSVRGFGP